MPTRPTTFSSRNVSHGRKDAAVGGVVAVVAEHEQVTGGHGEDIGIVVETSCRHNPASRGSLPPAASRASASPLDGPPPHNALSSKLSTRSRLDRRAVDDEALRPSSECDRREAHDALDVVGRDILGQAEDDHIAARGNWRRRCALKTAAVRMAANSGCNHRGISPRRHGRPAARSATWKPTAS